MNYRLPSETEWEFAARSGSKSEVYAGGDDPYKVAWYDDISNGATHPVGEKAPNGWGLYDMSGNVSEWVEDCWHKNYKGAPVDGAAWYSTDGGDCGRRVVRGGSWFNEPFRLRSAYRGHWTADDRSYSVGFPFGPGLTLFSMLFPLRGDFKGGALGPLAKRLGRRLTEGLSNLRYVCVTSGVGVTPHKIVV